MEENYKLEKEYKLTYEIFREGYTQFQKKNVYPKSYIFMTIFFIIGVIYIIAAFKDPSNKMAYALIFVSLALSFREWYNPRKIRRNFLDTVKSMEEMNYKIQVADEWIDISTVQNEVVENSENPTDETKNNEESEVIEEIEEELPKKTRISLNDDISIQEYENFFLLLIQKMSFYIIPKKGWESSELDVIREIGKVSK